MFGAGVKKDAAPATGLAEFAELVAASSLPVVAIGGIQLANCASLIEAGANGVAVVSAICGQHNPGRATAVLRDELHSALRRQRSGG